MKLKNNHYYWVRLVTMYRGSQIPKKEISKELTIAKYELYDDNSGHCWDIVGSDEGYQTYESDEAMEHSETCVIPISSCLKRTFNSDTRK